MPFIFLAKERRTAVARNAAAARAHMLNRLAAVILVVAYNAVGALDIYSTEIGLARGVAAEANPLVHAAMAHAGQYWIFEKLLLQGVVTAMILYFPHWIVLGLFSLSLMLNAGVVYNNFAIVFSR